MDLVPQPGEFVRAGYRSVGQGGVRIAADSTMFLMVNLLIALSLGVHREQLEQRIGLTWPRPFLLRPLEAVSLATLREARWCVLGSSLLDHDGLILVQVRGLKTCAGEFGHTEDVLSKSQCGGWRCDVLSSKFKIHLGSVRSESRARLGARLRAKSWAPQHHQDVSNLNNIR
jgi:hypothetical protein